MSAIRSSAWCASSPSKLGEAGRYVHWGATTQDIMDTATVLQIRAALALVEARPGGGRRPRSRASPKSTATRRWPAARICSRRCRSPSATRRAVWLSMMRPPRRRGCASCKPRVLVGAVRRRRRHAGLARRQGPRRAARLCPRAGARRARRSPGMWRATASPRRSTSSASSPARSARSASTSC